MDNFILSEIIYREDSPAGAPTHVLIPLTHITLGRIQGTQALTTSEAYKSQGIEEMRVQMHYIHINFLRDYFGEIEEILGDDHNQIVDGKTGLSLIKPMTKIDTVPWHQCIITSTDFWVTGIYEDHYQWETIFMPIDHLKPRDLANWIYDETMRVTGEDVARYVPHLEITAKLVETIGQEVTHILQEEYFDKALRKAVYEYTNHLTEADL